MYGYNSYIATKTNVQTDKKANLWLRVASTAVWFTVAYSPLVVYTAVHNSSPAIFTLVCSTKGVGP